MNYILLYIAVVAVLILPGLPFAIRLWKDDQTDVDPIDHDLLRLYANAEDNHTPTRKDATQ